jgi:uncharacterized radical SAM superfamily Fe-S cluster-containing enzyme
MKDKFLEETIALCSKCLQRVKANIIQKEGKIFIEKFCNEHGKQIELLEENADYHLNKKNYDKPGNSFIPQTKVQKGCPFDCGLCSEHQQHTCTALIEVTNACDLKCPVCYANSGKNNFRSLEKIEEMMDFFQKIENNKAEILQISGGEPTMHPKIIEIIKIAKTKKFRYLMLNSNGLRIANDEEFVKQLSQFRDRFEIYLQFDGFSEKTYKFLRGDENLLKIKLKAIENLQKYKIPITLVVTVKKGLNDKEIGKIIKFGMKTPFIRGINFQSICYFGRNPDNDFKNRITLSGIVKEIESQAGLKKGDIVPLPCDVHSVAVSYFYKKNGKFYPLTRDFNVKSYLPIIDNTFAFDADKIIRDKKELITQPGIICDCMKSFLKNTNSLIPDFYSKLTEEQKTEWWDNNTFRISVVSFMDAYNFYTSSIKKECVHIITPDLKRIPFSVYNMLYRK